MNQTELVKNVPKDIVLRRVPLIFMMIKRMGDIFGSIIGIMVTLPMIVIICLLIVIESPGSPIFIQERLGLYAKSFKIIKLRTMRINAEEQGIQWAEKYDDRITKVGYIIRRTRIDEIPQFINILKGEMSIVGPRPERPFFYNEFEKNIPYFRSRLQVKPGLTGWAQVNGGYDILPEQKLKLDLEYIKKASIWLDLFIIVKTIKVVFTREGAR